MTATVAGAKVRSAKPSRPRASETRVSVSVELSEPATAAPGVRTTLPEAPGAIGAGLARPSVALVEVAVTRRLSWKAASEAMALVTARLRVRFEPARTLPRDSVEATDGRAYS